MYFLRLGIFIYVFKFDFCINFRSPNLILISGSRTVLLIKAGTSVVVKINCSKNCWWYYKNYQHSFNNFIINYLDSFKSYHVRNWSVYCYFKNRTFTRNYIMRLISDIPIRKLYLILTAKMFGNVSHDFGSVRYNCLVRVARMSILIMKASWECG